MPHDKIRAAALERMARTGEPYAAALLAVLAEYGEAMRSRRAVLMSGEIRDWLAGLRDRDPAAVKGIGQTLAVLLSGGERRAGPLIDSTADSWPAALAEGLDRSCREQLERLRVLRRGFADSAALFKDISGHAAALESAQAHLRDRQRLLLEAGKTGEAAQAADALAAVPPIAARLRELQAKVARTGLRLNDETRRLQTRATDFGVRKEVLKATYASAQLDAALNGDTAQAAPLRAVIAQMEQELGQGPWPPGLSELGPACAHETGIRLLFAFEPAGTVLLIAVLDGPVAVRDRYLEAVLLSADRLREVRAGQAPDATEHGYDSVQGFLDEFYPGSSSSSSSSSSSPA
jgi:phage shock protein A